MQARATISTHACGAFVARLTSLIEEIEAGLFVPQACEVLEAQEPLVAVQWRGAIVGRTRAHIAQAAHSLAGATFFEAHLELPPDLGAFALAMRAAGLSQGWRGEALDLHRLVDSASPEAPLGQLERALFRPIGATTRAVHFVGLTKYPRSSRERVFLIGLRSHKKRIGPGLWDGLAAGMVQAGESPKAALLREAAEEAGLLRQVALTPIAHFLVSRPVPEGWMREVAEGAFAVLPEDFTPRAVDGEVERFACVSAEELIDLNEAHQMMHEAGLVCLKVAKRLFA